MIIKESRKTSTNCMIIAEVGVNHNGRLETAFQLVDAAVAAGVDAVKFQTFKTEKLVTQTAAKADYQKATMNTEETQFDMLKHLELTYEFHFQLLEYCQKQQIQFLSTAFDFDSLEFLNRQLNVGRLKIASGEITNGPFLLAHAVTGKEIILSTGMSFLGEVEEALSVLAFGLLGSQQPPSRDAFRQAYCSQQGQKILREKVILLHCTSEYPTPMENIHLRAMNTLAQAFGLRVGYSDHSEGITVPIAAVALGATVIEKHFTLDKKQPGPDHKVSLEPDELQAMVAGIRAVEKALGSRHKSPQLVELENQKVVRKSLVATCSINQGDCFTKENITIKRPGNGKNPMDYWSLLGQSSQRDYSADELI